jgi:hypothetical protein
MDRASPTTPCQVHRVFVRGAQHTHESVVKQELRALGAAATLGEIHQVCAVAAARLEALAVFESAEFMVDRARADDAAGDMPLADIIVTVSEKKRLASASTGVHTSGGEGSMDAEVRARQGPLVRKRWDACPRSMRRCSTAWLLEPAPRYTASSALLASGSHMCVTARSCSCGCFTSLCSRALASCAGVGAQCIWVRRAAGGAHGGGAAQVQQLPSARDEAAAVGNRLVSPSRGRKDGP